MNILSLTRIKKASWIVPILLFALSCAVQAQDLDTVSTSFTATIGDTVYIAIEDVDTPVGVSRSQIENRYAVFDDAVTLRVDAITDFGVSGIISVTGVPSGADPILNLALEMYNFVSDQWIAGGDHIWNGTNTAGSSTGIHGVDLRLDLTDLANGAQGNYGFSIVFTVTET